jgi:hypothetical protein
MNRKNAIQAAQTVRPLVYTKEQAAKIKRQQVDLRRANEDRRHKNAA